jgi:hypothetical protein
MVNAVVRIYDNAPGLVDALLAHEDDVRALLTSVEGFRVWGLVRTDTGGFSSTVCETAEGCAETVKLAAAWVKDNVPGDIAPPRVLEGEELMAFFSDDYIATGIPDNPRVALIIFPAPPPPSVKDGEEELRSLMTSVPGFRLWAAHPMTNGSGGFVFAVNSDQAGLDEMAKRGNEFNQSKPDIVAALAGREPEVIVGDSVKLIRP